jgi:hypothetical protein
MRGLGFWKDQDKVDRTWNNIEGSGKYTDKEFPASMDSLYFPGYTQGDNSARAPYS